MKLYNLMEGISSVVFHYTSVNNALSILKTNEFKLTTSFGTDAEGWLSKKDKIYFLSTTRHKLGGFHLPSGVAGAMLVLDGNKLKNKFSGSPVDYWGDEFAKLNPQGKEAEDRIYHNKPVIQNAISYITEAHVYVRTKDLDDRTTSRTRKLIIELKKNDIPTYFYNNHKDWLIQNKQKSIPFPSTFTPANEPGYYRKRRSFIGYKELFYKSSYSELSKDGKRVHDYLYNKHDFVTQLKNDIHNNKSNVVDSGVYSLLQLFKKLKLKSVNDAFDYLHDKWVTK